MKSRADLKNDLALAKAQLATATNTLLSMEDGLRSANWEIERKKRALVDQREEIQALRDEQDERFRITALSFATQQTPGAPQEDVLRRAAAYELYLRTGDSESEASRTERAVTNTHEPHPKL